MTQGVASILLVEDDLDISAIAMIALHLDPDLTIMPMRTAADALQYLQQSPKPDLMLTDNNLPDMDGVALMKAVRAASTEPPPIAFFTASVRPSDIEQYTLVGAVGTIVKPFDPVGLAAQVRALIPNERQ